MRTREEQAKDMAVGIEGNERPSELLIWLMTKELKEAERRAEQRVRAEIGRDSERLEWLNKDFFENGAVLFTGRYENMGTPNWKAIGVAHEDYIELGYKPTIREAIDAAREAE